MTDAGGVDVVCCSEDIKEREEREEEKEGLSGRTGLKGLWIYEELCFKEGGTFEEEQQRLTGLIVGQEACQVYVKCHKSASAPLSLAKKHPRYASEKICQLQKKNYGITFRVVGVGLAIVAPLWRPRLCLNEGRALGCEQAIQLEGRSTREQNRKERESHICLKGPISLGL